MGQLGFPANIPAGRLINNRKKNVFPLLSAGVLKCTAGAGMMVERVGGVPAGRHHGSRIQEHTMSESLDSILKHPEFPRGKLWRETFYGPDDMILRQGETRRDLYLIASGTGRVNRQVEVDDARIVPSGLIEPTHGDTFGELNLYGQADRSASVVALSDAEIVRIDGKALSAFMGNRGHSALRR
jgi:CRP-like cAMP-binding protein